MLERGQVEPENNPEVELFLRYKEGEARVLAFDVVLDVVLDVMLGVADDEADDGEDEEEVGKAVPI